jgi:hypothetical protein
MNSISLSSRVTCSSTCRSILIPLNLRVLSSSTDGALLNLLKTQFFFDSDQNNIIAGVHKF